MSLTLAACALGILGPSARGVELYGRSVSFPTWEAPISAEIGDFNGDGFQDVALLFGFWAGALLGDGLGGFEPSGLFFADAPLRSLVAADFNVDGALDLAVSDNVGERLSIALGNGQGQFCEGSAFSCDADSIPVAGGPWSLATADFNEDGFPDLAVGLVGIDAVRILLGDGEGGVASSLPDVTVGDGPRMVVADDFNLDGQADLAVANYFGDSVSILLGDGTGSFPDTQEIVVGVRPRYLVADDFDLDGNRDLAVAMNGEDSVRLLVGDGTGQFSVMPGVPVGDAPVWLAVADLENDGTPDLAVANYNDESLSLLRGDGEGGFVKVPDIDVGGAPTAIAADDFDGDTALDLVVANYGSESLDILPGDGLGGLAALTELEFPSSTVPSDVKPWLCITVGDFDGDGRDDAAVASRKDDALSILLGEAKDGLTHGPQIEIGSPGCSHAADYDGNGTLDLAVAQPDQGTLSILDGLGDGGFVPSAEFFVGGHPSSVAGGDFNNDGTLDFVVAQSFSEDHVSILLGDGQGGFGPPADIRSCSKPHCGPLHASVADFNGDGASDLAVANWYADSAGILEGDGEGAFALTEEISVGRFHWVHAADFNGDGAFDVAVCDNGGMLDIQLGDGTGEFDEGPTQWFISPWNPVAGDFNDDGLMDLAVGQGRSIAVTLGDGEHFSRIPDAKVTNQPVYTATGDFNGDGAPDLLTASLEGTLSLALGQLFDRADVNGSNRTDGFDVNAVSRLSGVWSDHPAYNRNVDVNINGVIDGDDLALLTLHFGELRKRASPLRAELEEPVPSAPDTVTLRQVASEGDLLTVQVLINDSDDPAAAASFGVTFDPSDQVSGQLLEYVQFEPGSYLAGGVSQLYVIDEGTPGRIDVSAARLPAEDRIGSGEQPLVNLIFRARREGEALFEFVASDGHTRPALLNAANEEVEGVVFVGSVGVTVSSSAGEAPGQRISLSPEQLDFGETAIGGTKRKKLRIANFGFAELEVMDARPLAGGPEFRSFFTAPFAVPPFGFVELWVEFSPTTAGAFSSELVILSNDPEHPERRVPLSGTSPSGAPP